MWVGDITYIATEAGWLYLAVVIDLFSRQVVGWKLRDDMTSSIVMDALKEYGITSSISRRGNCWVNACSETLFGSLKLERLHGQRCVSRRHARDETIA